MQKRKLIGCRSVVMASARAAGCLWFLLTAAAAQTYTITPTTIDFGSCAVGVYVQRSIQVTNTGKVDISVNSFSLSPSQFQLQNGWAPATIHAGLSLFYTMRFFPDSAKSFSGQATVTVENVPTVVSLSGVGTTASGMAKLNDSDEDFGFVLQGAWSQSRLITLSNGGSGSFTLESVTADPPFVAEGFTQAVTLNPGASIQVTLKMWGGLTGAYTGDLVFGFDSLPPKGVSLSGKVLHSKSIAITSYPSLPEATVSSPYAAVLAASGGRPPYTWSVVGGSHLPNGLSLSSEGEISGTLDASVKTGTYAFSVKVLGSGSQGKSDTLSLTLSVSAKPTTTNSLLPNCNGAYYPNLVSPLIALTDLGTGQYMGQEGGLYPGGSNVRPPVHETAGVTIASRIQPLNREGKPDPDGRYVLLGLGMSETQDDFDQFLIDAKADPSTNNHLVFANGAQDATVAADWANPTAAQWTTVLNYILPQNEVTAQQVVAAWVKDVDEPSGSFPPDEVPTQEDLESIARNLHTFFPNLKLAYFSSRIYGGYCSGDPVNSEPHSYESGFAVKWAITDQINGNSDLNFDPSAGPVVAPWIAWGPYDWANGLFTRRDGEVWTCEDFKDGIHPSNPGGRERDANQLLNFFKNDTTTIPWFLQH